MADWDDINLEAKLEMLSVQLLYFILGLYGWEYIRSLHVEIALLRRQLAFRWALLSYITARFSFLIAIVCLATQFSPFPTGVDCQSMNTFIMLAINAAIGCSTTNLMVRTWIIWTNSYLLRLLLVVLSLGHWTILTLFVASARASSTNGMCMITFVNPAYSSAVVIYGMSYDLLLLVWTVVGLWSISSSTLWKLLVKQGVIYFVINLVVNIILLLSWMVSSQFLRHAFGRNSRYNFLLHDCVQPSSTLSPPSVRQREVLLFFHPCLQLLRKPRRALA
ncbi:uncharacterized protein EDB91DRAFT_1082617 [Suillus paluster]|uniref:uncharacterized protein n=1 Tax=Suillus paluster TaxID=48578 RepID=UPI001B885F34|nr:uncharacterized protein EDB91DRAFT_1082617 [Suillus paluster]KAG1738923.1 hypothetical protein EDB91DRAFT_1082617 [Suillus paluster]